MNNKYFFQVMVPYFLFFLFLIGSGYLVMEVMDIDSWEKKISQDRENYFSDVIGALSHISESLKGTAQFSQEKVSNMQTHFNEIFNNTLKGNLILQISDDPVDEEPKIDKTPHYGYFVVKSVNLSDKNLKLIVPISSFVEKKNGIISVTLTEEFEKDVPLYKNIGFKVGLSNSIEIDLSYFLHKNMVYVLILILYALSISFIIYRCIKKSFVLEISSLKTENRNISSENMKLSSEIIGLQEKLIKTSEDNSLLDIRLIKEQRLFSRYYSEVIECGKIFDDYANLIKELTKDLNGPEEIKASLKHSIKLLKSKTASFISGYVFDRKLDIISIKDTILKIIEDNNICCSKIGVNISFEGQDITYHGNVRVVSQLLMSLMHSTLDRMPGKDGKILFRIKGQEVICEENGYNFTSKSKKKFPYHLSKEDQEKICASEGIGYTFIEIDGVSRTTIKFPRKIPNYNAENVVPLFERRTDM